MDTAALQSAIDACGPGEEVFLPAGDYKTGALRLHSDMALHLDRDAVLHGTADPEDYLPRIPSRFEGTELECYSSLLNLGHLDHDSGPNARNVLIYGAGTIISGGHTLFGLEIKGTKKRGGYVRDIQAQDCRLPRLLVHAVGYNDDGVPAPHPPVFEHFRFERLDITGRALDHKDEWSDVSPLELVGFDVPGHELRAVVLHDCTLPADGMPVVLRHCRELSLKNLRCGKDGV